MSKRAALGLFTLGVEPDRFHLPHPRLGLPVILLVRRVVLCAFDRLREQSFPLATAKEDEITAALRSIIENDFRQTGCVRGFSRRTYETVVRQGQVANYDLSRLTKSPDLCFKLRNDEEEPSPVLSEHDALFVECKPVDNTHAAGGKYCDDGLCRFVNGDYAWAMEEALMLGYARHSRSIEKNLIQDMQEPTRFNALRTVELPAVVRHPGAGAVEHAETLYVSRHHRGFLWVANKGVATDIFVYHSWHDCG
jgi:hypothetical protein